MGLRRVAVHFRNGRRGERGRTSPGGGRPEKRRGGRGEHRPTVSQGRTSGRGTRRPGPRAARGRGQVVRPSRNGAHRAGEDQDYRRSRRDPHDLPGPQVKDKKEQDEERSRIGVRVAGRRDGRSKLERLKLIETKT